MIDIFINLIFDVTHMESSAEYNKWPRYKKNQRLGNPAEIIILRNTQMVLTTFERIVIRLPLSNKTQKSCSCHNSSHRPPGPCLSTGMTHIACAICAHTRALQAVIKMREAKSCKDLQRIYCTVLSS